jgi:hypothetical protein
MKFHGNDKQNTTPNHLYEILDKLTDETHKFGISHDPLDADGLSNRVRLQLSEFNLIAGWERFYARILILDISGRAMALELEAAHIEAFFQKNGRKPPGNRK